MSPTPDDGDIYEASPKLPVPEDVREAVKVLLRWTGEDPDREGLLETPERVARAWAEYAQGYKEDPAVHLSRTFHEVGGYDEIVLLKDIPFQSHCEHQLAPINRQGAIGYLPKDQGRRIQQAAPVPFGSRGESRPGTVRRRSPMIWQT